MDDAKTEQPMSIPSETLDFFNRDELRARVFYEKYTLLDPNGKTMEAIPTQMWKRVATEMSNTEAAPEKKSEWFAKFYWLLEDWRFVPGGRILFGAGQPARKVTLINCYVIPVKEDSIEGIFNWCKEAARTYSYSGGVGTDISVLRPRGSAVHNSARASTGSVSFMNIMSETTGVIGQAGRRGALMITIRVDHPDVMEFIKVKQNLKNVRFANISVRVTDEFMRAVEKDDDFTLWYENPVVGRIEKRVRAREIWSALIASARDWAEPGVIFWDAVQRGSPSEYNGMNVITTNPCSEQPLDPYGDCDLGHLNLVKFVKDGYTDKATVDWETLEKATRFGVRFLDDVLTYNDPKHPLKDQMESSRSSRRIGLGITGLADMLIKMGIKYDTDEALQFVDNLLERIKTVAYDESTEIAKEKGPFLKFDAQKHLSMPFVKGLRPEIREKIAKNGLRNVCLLTVAPVGSGSVLVGTSSGVEPIFAFSYTRRSESLSKEYFKVYQPIVAEYMSKFRLSREEDLPAFFVPAHKINAEFRVRMQATVQKHIDSAISSTVNLPESSTVDDVGRIYLQAWKSGCKGITVYREGSREGILITEEQEKKQKAGMQAKWERPSMMNGETVTFRLPNGKIYITINSDVTGPKEVFVNLGKSGSEDKSYSEAIGRLISLYLQQGGDVRLAIKALKGIQGRTPTWDHGVQLLSVPDAIAKALDGVLNGSKQSLIEAHQDDPKGNPKEMVQVAYVKGKDGSPLGLADCPKCGEHTLVNENGCETCRNCSYSRCG